MKRIIVSVWVEITLWVAVIVGVFIAILRLSEPPGPDWPSWVQAVGSIVAIAASARIAQVTFKKAEAQHFADAARREKEEADRRVEALNELIRRETEEACRREDAIDEIARLKREEMDRQRAAIHNTELLALQLMVKAEESTKRVADQINRTTHIPNVAFSSKGEFDALIVGLKSVDSRHLDSFDKFEQCIHVLGACMAMSEHMGDWGTKGKPSSGDQVIKEHRSVISSSATRFRQLTGLDPLKRNHAATFSQVYLPDDGPIVATAYSATSEATE